MADIETFGGSVISMDPLYEKQKENVTKMRSALLSCSSDNLSSASAKQALKNITAMRIYHQIARIIKYLDLMDKVEDKLYKSIESTLDRLDENSMGTWHMLIGIQSQLQKTMIESHKLLQPYLELQDIQVIDLIPSAESSTEISSANVIPAESRQKIRDAAGCVLQSLEALDDSKDSEEG